MPTFSGMRGLKNNLLKKNYLEVKQQLANAGSANANPVSLSFATQKNQAWTFLDAVDDTWNMWALSMSTDETKATMIHKQGYGLFYDTRPSATSNWASSETDYVTNLNLATTDTLLTGYGIAMSRDGVNIVTTVGTASRETFILIKNNTAPIKISIPSPYNRSPESVALTQDGTTAAVSGTYITMTTGLNTGIYAHTTLWGNWQKCSAIAICNINNVVIVPSPANNGEIAIISYQPTPITIFTNTVLKTSANVAITNIRTIDFLWFSSNAPPSFIFVRTFAGSYIYKWDPVTKRIVLTGGNALPIATTTLVKSPTQISTDKKRYNYNNTYMQDTVQLSNTTNFINKLRVLNVEQDATFSWKQYSTLDINPIW